MLLCSSRYIQSTCATSGEGLYEGLDWLSNNIANKVRMHPFQVFPTKSVTTKMSYLGNFPII